MIIEHMAYVLDRPVGRGSPYGDHFTSFREIHISVMSVFPSGGGPAMHPALQDMRLSKSSTLTKCSGCQHARSGKSTMLLVQIVEQGTQKALLLLDMHSRGARKSNAVAHYRRAQVS